MLAIVAVGVFFRVVRHDQFEDLDTPKILPLLDASPSTDDSAADPKPAAPTR